MAAMELILEIGVENIARELLRKRAWLVPRIAGERLHRACTPTRPPENASGIISFFRPAKDPAALHRKT